MIEQPAAENSRLVPHPSPRRVTARGLDELLDLSPDALVVINQAGTILQANEQAATLFGYRPEELQGQPLELLLPERFKTLHVAHRQHYFSEPRTRAMGTGLALFGRRQDGREIAVDISLRSAILGDELIAIAAIRDVSEMRRAERERLQHAERLHLQAELLSLAHDAILVRDLADRVTFWNSGAQELYGWTEAEALGRVTHSLLRTVSPESLAEVNEHLDREGRWEGELLHTCRDGSAVVVESRQAVVRDMQGQPSAILEINRDITRRRQLE